MSTEEQSTRQARSREVGCTNAAGHAGVIKVFPLTGSRVGIRTPSGEQFDLSAEQLRDLLVAAREAIRESHPNYDPTPRTRVVGGPCS